MGEILSPKMLILLLMVVAYIVIFPIIVMRKGKKQPAGDDSVENGKDEHESGKSGQKGKAA